MSTHHVTRQGTLLIIVAGVSALMASLGLAFLVRMRSDLQESEALMREAQAHIMLVAACQYLQEASRIGYDDPATTNHEEAYGWIDIRDGSVGPKPTALSTQPSAVSDGHLLVERNPTLADGALIKHGRDYDRLFPQQTARRFDLYVKQVPPFAISLDAAPNAIDPADGVPWLVEPDPKPQLTTSFTHFSSGLVGTDGKSIPRMNSVGKSWFRLLRCGAGPDANLARYNAATFIVTCGAGETRGFRSRDWDSTDPNKRIPDADKELFGNDQSFLASLEANEARLWYLVEWSPAVGGLHQFNLVHHRGAMRDANNESYTFTQYSQFPPNHSFYSHSHTKERNFGGTIRMVQRLGTEPPEW